MKYLLTIFLLLPFVGMGQTPQQVGGNSLQGGYVPGDLRLDKGVILNYIPAHTDTVFLMVLPNNRVMPITWAQLQRKVVAPPYTTAQRNSLPVTSANAGLMIYNTTTNTINFYNGTAWKAVVTDP